MLKLCFAKTSGCSIFTVTCLGIYCTVVSASSECKLGVFENSFPLCSLYSSGRASSFLVMFVPRPGWLLGVLAIFNFFPFCTDFRNSGGKLCAVNTRWATVSVRLELPG